MSTIDQQFVEYIVKALVNNPDDVVVDRRVDEKGVLLELTVNPEDLGRVIGKRGITAQSLRTLLRALGTKNDARYNLKIVNNDDYVPAQRRDDDQQPSDNQTQSEPPSDQPVDEPASDDAQNSAHDDDVVQNSTEETVEKESDLAQKTRKELADLDDLDI